MREKTFYKTLLRFSKDPENAKERLNDKRLTQAEKKIITGYLNIRDNKNQDVLDSLINDTPSSSIFVESQRLLLLGSAMNNLSDYTQAERYLTLSIKMLKGIEAPYFHFFANFILFWIKANLNEVEELKLILSEMSAIPISNQKQEIRLLRCKFCYYQMSEDNLKAQDTLNQIELIKNALSESDLIQFLTDKFIFYVQIENYKKSYDTLDEMKFLKKFHLSESYSYMKMLLDHLTKDSPIYAYEKDFENIPLLLHQIKCIQSLEECKIDKAKNHWHSLELISPKNFSENFNYQGNKCLFSLCLEKHRHKLNSTASFDTIDTKSKLSLLVHILTSAKAPLAAGLIFEEIWKRPPEEKEDLKKLARLIFRAKKEKNLKVEYRKGTYFVKGQITKNIKFG